MTKVESRVSVFYGHISSFFLALSVFLVLQKLVTSSPDPLNDWNGFSATLPVDMTTGVMRPAPVYSPPHPVPAKRPQISARTPRDPPSMYSLFSFIIKFLYYHAEKNFRIKYSNTCEKRPPRWLTDYDLYLQVVFIWRLLCLTCMVIKLLSLFTWWSLFGGGL